MQEFIYLIEIKDGEHKGKFYSFPNNPLLMYEYLTALDEVKNEKEGSYCGAV